MKVWDAKTHECMHTYRPAHQQQMTAMKGGKGRGEEAMSEQIVPVLAIIPLPRRPDSLVVCTKSATVYIMTTSGLWEKGGREKERERGKRFLKKKKNHIYLLIIQ